MRRWKVSVGVRYPRGRHAVQRGASAQPSQRLSQAMAPCSTSAPHAAERRGENAFPQLSLTREGWSFGCWSPVKWWENWAGRQCAPRLTMDRTSRVSRLLLVLPFFAAIVKTDFMGKLMEGYIFFTVVMRLIQLRDLSLPHYMLSSSSECRHIQWYS